MTETATVKHPPNKNYTDPPLIFFQQLYCAKCGLHCNASENRFQNCLLVILTDELTRIRQLLQQRTQHVGW
jgi:hypothetical protein